MHHLISCIVQNRSGVLAHIANMFASRGFNIDSLAVGITEDPKFSRMTIVVRGDELVLEQIRKQLGRIIDVIKVFDLTEIDYVARDLVLIKVHAPAAKRAEISQVTEVFRGQVLDVSQREMIIEMLGTEDKVEAFLDLMRAYGLKEVARTGRVAMARGPRMAGERRREKWKKVEVEM